MYFNLHKSLSVASLIKHENPKYYNWPAIKTSLYKYFLLSYFSLIAIWCVWSYFIILYTSRFLFCLRLSYLIRHIRCSPKIYTFVCILSCRSIYPYYCIYQDQYFIRCIRLNLQSINQIYTMKWRAFSYSNKL